MTYLRNWGTEVDRSSDMADRTTREGSIECAWPRKYTRHSTSQGVKRLVTSVEAVIKGSRRDGKAEPYGRSPTCRPRMCAESDRGSRVQGGRYVSRSSKRWIKVDDHKGRLISSLFSFSIESGVAMAFSYILQMDPASSKRRM